MSLLEEVKDINPVQTLYVRNLNDKIKPDGKSNPKVLLQFRDEDHVVPFV